MGFRCEVKVRVDVILRVWEEELHAIVPCTEGGKRRLRRSTGPEDSSKSLRFASETLRPQSSESRACREPGIRGQQFAHLLTYLGIRQSPADPLLKVRSALGDYLESAADLSSARLSEWDIGERDTQ
jgi:hypothetical protein